AGRRQDAGGSDRLRVQWRGLGVSHRGAAPADPNAAGQELGLRPAPAERGGSPGDPSGRGFPARRAPLHHTAQPRPAANWPCGRRRLLSKVLRGFNWHFVFSCCWWPPSERALLWRKPPVQHAPRLASSASIVSSRSSTTRRLLCTTLTIR